MNTCTAVDQGAKDFQWLYIDTEDSNPRDSDQGQKKRDEPDGSPREFAQVMDLSGSAPQQSSSLSSFIVMLKMWGLTLGLDGTHDHSHLPEGAKQPHARSPGQHISGENKLSGKVDQKVQTGDEEETKNIRTLVPIVNKLIKEAQELGARGLGMASGADMGVRADRLDDRSEQARHVSPEALESLAHAASMLDPVFPSSRPAAHLAPSRSPSVTASANTAPSFEEGVRQGADHPGFTGPLFAALARLPLPPPSPHLAGTANGPGRGRHGKMGGSEGYTFPTTLFQTADVMTWVEERIASLHGQEKFLEAQHQKPEQQHPDLY